MRSLIGVFLLGILQARAACDCSEFTVSLDGVSDICGMDDTPSPICCAVVAPFFKDPCIETWKEGNSAVAGILDVFREPCKLLYSADCRTSVEWSDFPGCIECRDYTMDLTEDCKEDDAGITPKCCEAIERYSASHCSPVYLQNNPDIVEAFDVLSSSCGVETTAPATDCRTEWNVDCPTFVEQNIDALFTECVPVWADTESTEDEETKVCCNRAGTLNSDPCVWSVLNSQKQQAALNALNPVSLINVEALDIIEEACFFSIAPTVTPTLAPSYSPTVLTSAPSRNPTGTTSSPTTTAPTVVTNSPTQNPTLTPTEVTFAPSMIPTASPTAPTGAPSTTPTGVPSMTPTVDTGAPSSAPTAPTTDDPTPAPTTPFPTNAPSVTPTPAPSVSPTTGFPTMTPTPAKKPPSYASRMESWYLPSLSLSPEDFMRELKKAATVLPVGSPVYVEGMGYGWLHQDQQTIVQTSPMETIQGLEMMEERTGGAFKTPSFDVKVVYTVEGLGDPTEDVIVGTQVQRNVDRLDFWLVPSVKAGDQVYTQDAQIASVLSVRSPGPFAYNQSSISPTVPIRVMMPSGAILTMSNKDVALRSPRIGDRVYINDFDPAYGQFNNLDIYPGYMDDFNMTAGETLTRYPSAISMFGTVVSEDIWTGALVIMLDSSIPRFTGEVIPVEIESDGSFGGSFGSSGNSSIYDSLDEDYGTTDEEAAAPGEVWVNWTLSTTKNDVEHDLISILPGPKLFNAYERDQRVAVEGKGYGVVLGTALSSASLDEFREGYIILYDTGRIGYSVRPENVLPKTAPVLQENTCDCSGYSAPSLSLCEDAHEEDVVLDLGGPGDVIFPRAPACCALIHAIASSPCVHALLARDLMYSLEFLDHVGRCRERIGNDCRSIWEDRLAATLGSLPYEDEGDRTPQEDIDTPEPGVKPVVYTDPPTVFGAPPVVLTQEEIDEVLAWPRPLPPGFWSTGGGLTVPQPGMLDLTRPQVEEVEYAFPIIVAPQFGGDSGVYMDFDASISSPNTVLRDFTAEYGASGYGDVFKSSSSCQKLGWLLTPLPSAAEPSYLVPYDTNADVTHRFVCGASKLEEEDFLDAQDSDMFSTKQGCPQPVAFKDAESYCAAAGARLCTVWELENDVTVDGRCDGVAGAIWSKDVCTLKMGLTGLKTVKGGASSGSGPEDRVSCSSTAKAKSARVHCCASDSPFEIPKLSKATCTKLKWPIAMVSAHKMGVDEQGDSAVSTHLHVHAHPKCGASTVFDTSTGCGGEVKFMKAYRICKAARARLCSLEEILDGVVAGTGCALDDQPVWSSEMCAGGVFVAVQTTGQVLCQQALTSAAVRCCADEV